MDRAFELLLKASIRHEGGKIRDRGERETYGLDRCVRQCLSKEEVKCLVKEEALTIQIINSLRDAAQHYILDVAEPQLYTYTQAGVTLFGDLLERSFSQKLTDYLPDRVLPVSTTPPTDFSSMIDLEFREIKQIVQPGSRKRLRAHAKLRALAVVEASLRGERSQPSEGELNKLIREIQENKRWQTLFPGVATLRLDTEGTAGSISIRITKKEGEAVHLVTEGTPGATVVAVKRVNELDFYSLSTTNLAKKLHLSVPRTLALVQHFNIKDSEAYYKVFRIGKSPFKRYSHKALEHLRANLIGIDMNKVWEDYKTRPRTKS